MSRITTASISIDALKHNYSIVKKVAPQSKILAVIKADAYGHGMLIVAEALQAADAFAVARISEAKLLRQQYPQKKIVLLQGFSDATELALLIDLKIDPVIHHLDQIEIFEKASIPKNFSVWLKINTGMNRLGIAIEDFPTAWSRLTKIKCIENNIQLMSHFANADEVENTGTQKQIQTFDDATKSLKTEKSLANSAGLLNWPSSHYQWVRPGIMLYGVSPFINQIASDQQLKPVMTLKSHIIVINRIKKSQAVGYGSQWRANADTDVAVVACGYGDGYPRHIADGTLVLIKNVYYPIVGTVSMDMICVNIGKSHALCVGDSVTLWGEGLPVETIAEKAGTIAYELLCQLTSRIKIEIN